MRLILDQAQALVDTGLAAKGYDTVTVDDCWSTMARDADGGLTADTSKFPGGMADLGTQLHSMGLKFGIYGDIGTTTCGGFPGSWGHFQQDADLFASWGVDFIKLDGCNMPSSASSAAGYISAYDDFAAAMKANASGRDMVFSESSPAYFYIGASDLSDWYDVIDGASKSGQLWRGGYDVKMHNMGGSAWDKDTNGAGVMAQYAYNSPLSRYAAPGSWNDPDFLIPGEALTDEESRSQFALWSMMASPLILSTDVTSLSPESLATVGNADIIAIDQDPLGRQAGIVSRDGTVDVLARPLANGDRAVSLLNRGSTAVRASTTPADIGFLGGDGCSVSVKDLWTGATSTTSAIGATVPPHGTAVFRVTPGAGCTGQQPTGQITGIGGKCVDDSGAGTASGNPVVLYSCNMRRQPALDPAGRRHRPHPGQLPRRETPERQRVHRLLGRAQPLRRQRHPEVDVQAQRLPGERRSARTLPRRLRLTDHRRRSPDRQHLRQLPPQPAEPGLGPPRLARRPDPDVPARTDGRDRPAAGSDGPRLCVRDVDVTWQECDRRRCGAPGGAPECRYDG